MRDDMFRQLDAVLKQHLEENRRSKVKKLFPSTILIPTAYFQARFGDVESVFVCLSNGAVEVRATSHNGIYFE